MSIHPLGVSGLPTKPRNLQPSMFEILSWAGQNELAQSKFIQNHKDDHCLKQQCCNTVVNQLKNEQKVLPIVEEIYKQDHRQSPQKCSDKQNIDAIKQDLLNKQSLRKSRLYPKQIKHELNSFQPVHLKASRPKSVDVVQRPVVKQQKKASQQSKKQQLDQKTIQQRKQKIKQFQLFTRALPNSSFTTYYGKPAFEAYGRGTSCKDLKSYNIMPHKGDNHPKKPQSHYNALIKGRTIKSKSNMPRKPIEQPIIPANYQSDQQNQQLQNISFPIQKPDLIHNSRFATVRPDTSKKAGPPVVSKGTTKQTKPVKPKNNLQINSQSNKQRKAKSFVQPVNDGLKYLNKRQNLLQQLEQKKLKASQLAFKVTQCYPLQWNCSNLCQSQISYRNWQTIRPAGKQKQEGDHISDIFQGKKISQSTGIHIKK